MAVTIQIYGEDVVLDAKELKKVFFQCLDARVKEDKIRGDTQGKESSQKKDKKEI